jgi:septal ring factor EnvC (AmiA/AmiB activator)
MKIKILITITIAFSLSFIYLVNSLSSAEEDPQKKLKEIQRKLLYEKRKVKQTIKKEESILEELEKINKLLRQKNRELEYYNKKLSETKRKIALLEKDISMLNDKLDIRKNLLKQRLKGLYKQQHGEVASVLISARDYQELAMRIRYISLLARYDTKLMNNYRLGIKDLHDKKREMELLQKELELNKATVKKKKEEMENERARKDTLLASVRKKRDSYEQMVKELEDSSKKLRKMIDELADEGIPASIIGTKGFAALRRRLPWPINGEVIVPYGTYKDPKFNITTFRKGIEIKADIGDVVLAVAGGRVVYADWFKGYGLLLIINHGNGFHSLYAHLSEIFHKTGDIIKSRQAVGRIGETGVLNQPSLYFEIRYKGKPVNPLEWLRKKG